MGRPRKQTVAIQIEVSSLEFQLLCIAAYKNSVSTESYAKALIVASVAHQKEIPLFPGTPPVTPAAAVAAIEPPPPPPPAPKPRK